MFRHRFLPKRVPDGVCGSKSPLLRIDPSRGLITELLAKPLGADRFARIADYWLLNRLLERYGLEDFERGDLDGGRLNRLFDREIIASGVGPVRRKSFNQLLRLNPDLVEDWLEEGAPR